MILSDRELRAALNRGALRITPDPPAEAWSSTALDLRLENELVVWKAAGGKGVEAAICPFDPEYDYEDVKKRFSKQIQIPESGMSSNLRRSSWDGPLKNFNYHIVPALPHVWRERAAWPASA